MTFGTLTKLIHLKRTRSRSRRKVLASQLRLLRDLVPQAHAEVPMYRELYGDAGELLELPERLASLRDIPIVTKSLLKANFPDRIVSSRFDMARLYPVATSGTSDRVMTFQDEHKRDWDRAADLLLRLESEGYWPGRGITIPPEACYERCGVDEQGRSKTLFTRVKEVLQTRGSQRIQAARRVRSHVMQDYVWRRRVLTSLGMEGSAVGDDTVEYYVREFKDWHPRVVSGVPFVLYVLAKRRHSGDSEKLARVLRPSGGKATPEMIRCIEDRLGGRFRENYGTAELGTIAFDTSSSRRQRLLDELFIVEFLRAGKEVGPGELGEIVLTDLRNHAAPLIRYAVGDVGRYFSEGGHDFSFEVNGRIEETIVSPQGQAFPCDEVIDFFLRRPDVDYAKLVQQSEHRFLLEVVPNEEAGAAPSSESVSKSFSQFLGYPVDVRVRRVRRVAPEPSGKYKLVESASHSRFHSPRGQAVQGVK